MFNRMAKIVLTLCILAGGVYSFYSLDYLSKANPVKIVQAVQSFGQNSTTVAGGGNGTRPNQAPTSAGTNQGPPAQSKGEMSSFVFLEKLLLFFGVFVSTLTTTYLIDQAIKNRKNRNSARFMLLNSQN